MIEDISLLSHRDEGIKKNHDSRVFSGNRVGGRKKCLLFEFF